MQIIAFLLLIAYLYCEEVDRSVIISTNAPFASTSLLSQASVFVTNLNPSLFWTFLEFTSQEELWNKTDHDTFLPVLTFIKNITRSSALTDVAKASFLVHSATPFIESHHSLAKQTWIEYLSQTHSSSTKEVPSIFASFISTTSLYEEALLNDLQSFTTNNNTKIITNLKDILDELQNLPQNSVSNNSLLFNNTYHLHWPILPSDIIFPSAESIDSASAIIIVYAPFGSPEGYHWLKTLREHHDENPNFCIVYRHNMLPKDHVLSLAGKSEDMLVRVMELS